MTPFHFWISLFPQAPLFGVEWQFAKYFKSTETTAPQKSAQAPKPTMPVAAVEPAVVPVAAVEPAVVPVAETMVEASAGTEAPAEAAPVEETEALVPPATLYDIAPIDADDLKAMKGVGPKLEIMLNELGIYRFEQIAAFTPENLAWVDANLTAFKGRPQRDDWVAQAKALL
jgi:NADH-quinone oxidoreductase subunit E